MTGREQQGGFWGVELGMFLLLDLRDDLLLDLGDDRACMFMWS